MKLKEKNILLVHNYYQHSGGEDVVFENEYQLLKKNGHKVIKYTRNSNEINNFNSIQKFFFPINSIFSLRSFREVKSLIRKHNIDIIHVHNTWPLISPSIFYAARSLKIPIIQTIHNYRLICPSATLFFKGTIYEEALKQNIWKTVIDKVYKDSYIHTFVNAMTTWFHRKAGIYRNVNFICLTEFSKNKILEVNKTENTSVFLKDKFFIKPNFTDFPDEIKKRMSLYKDHFLFVGRLDDTKGIKLLLEAFKGLPDKKLLIVGSGPLENYVEIFLKENNCGNIDYLGYQSKKEVNKIMQSVKALIVPSQWYETFGMVVIEAYSNGLPVIASNIGNLKDIIKDEKTGIKFKYNDKNDLCNKVRAFEKMDRYYLSDNAFKYYNNSFTSKRNYEKLIEIYEKIL